MSICRFSSDNWKSDVYIYESDLGIEVHLAGRKLKRPSRVPQVGGLTKNRFDEFSREHKAQMEFLDSLTDSDYEDIPHRLAGKTVTVETITELYGLVTKLKSEGIYIPDSVFRILKEEG